MRNVVLLTGCQVPLADIESREGYPPSTETYQSSGTEHCFPYSTVVMLCNSYFLLLANSQVTEAAAVMRTSLSVSINRGAKD